MNKVLLRSRISELMRQCDRNRACDGAEKSFRGLNLYMKVQTDTSDARYTASPVSPVPRTHRSLFDGFLMVVLLMFGNSRAEGCDVKGTLSRGQSPAAQIDSSGGEEEQRIWRKATNTKAINSQTHQTGNKDVFSHKHDE